MVGHEDRLTTVGHLDEMHTRLILSLVAIAIAFGICFWQNNFLLDLLFQVPVGIVAITRAGLVTPRRLRKNRRYAVLACGAVAAVLPGDAVTLRSRPYRVYLLLELGVLLASFGHRKVTRAE